MRFAYAKSIGLRRLAYGGGGGNPAFVTAFNTDSGIEPTLVLDYENDSYWEDVDGTDTFASFHTFTRASEATYRDNTGTIQTATTDEKRLDHDKDGNPLGLLREESRTNICLHSEDIENQWTITGSPTFSAGSSALGIASERITASGDVDTKVSSPQFSVTDTVTYTFSVFARKNAGNGWIFLFVLGTGTGNATWFNLNTGVIGTTGADATAKIEDWGDGFYRCIITLTSESTSSTAGFRLEICDADGTSVADTGDAVDFVGAQVEEGAFATSYIPTTTASVTRAADVSSTATSAFGFNASAGTLHAVVTPNHTPSAEMILASLNDGTTDERIEIVADASANVDFDVIDGGASQASIDSTLTAAADTQLKAAAAYAANDFAVSVDGTAAQTDAAGTLPTVDTLAPIDNGHIKALVYYAERLPNADLVSLTS